MNAPWSEKYRPRHLDDIVGQTAVKSAIRGYLENGGIPHMLFHSETPGCGKTTMAQVIANEVLGEAGMKLNFIERNGSDDRSVDKVRTLITNTMRYQSLTGDLKIVVLDEADGLLKDAQELLRWPLDPGHATHVRFIFTANDIDSFIKPIISRLAVFKFAPLTTEDIHIRLQQILDAENVSLDAKIVREVAKNAHGDMRAAINKVQQSAYSYKAELEELRKQF